MSTKIKLFQVDAFTAEVFHGNPAAVCILEEWPEARKMQQIAAENNLAETAFVVRMGNDYEIRWFTPAVEVDLCGHATLAAAYVLFKYYDYPSSIINFHSRQSGLLSVEQAGAFLTLDFPTDIYEEVSTPKALIAALGLTPLRTYKGKTDYLLYFSSQKEIEDLHPDFSLLSTVGGRGVIVTAKGNTVDFVSRFFAPQSGIDEDPVTGSAHTTLIPFWSKILGKNVLVAKQLSKRQGDLTCEYRGDRVKITGQAVTYLQGEMEI
jgi:PhzF family phenazine biosynthesis protein